MCFNNGGGRVVVPAGTFIIGTIILKSNVNLYLENGAVLLGSTTIDDYKIEGKPWGWFLPKMPAMWVFRAWEPSMQAATAFTISS